MNFQIKNWFYPIITSAFVIYAFLLFYNLGHYPFWDDEANTAIFARNLLSTGHLSAFDGRNLAAYSYGVELNNELNNVLIPPMQYYIVASSFAVFGESNFSARLPFALLGLFSFIIFFLIQDKLNINRNVQLISILILSTNVAFVLFMRQSRYYAPVSFFFLLNALILINYYQNPHWKYLIAYLSSSILLFLSQYNAALGILALLSIYYAHFKNWEFRRRDFSLFILTNILIVIFIISYILYKEPFNTLMNYPGKGLSLTYKFYVFYASFISFDEQTFLSILLILLFLLFNHKITGRTPKALKQSLFFLLIAFTTFSIFSVKFAIRYVIYIAPVAFIIESYIIYYITKWPIRNGNIIGSLLAVLLILTPTLFVTSGNEAKINNPYLPISSHLIAYLDENLSDNSSTYSVLINYFDEKMDSQMVILTIPHFMSYPLMYYIGDQYYFTNQLFIETETIKKLPNYIYKDKVDPDYIVIAGQDILKKDETLIKYKSSYELDSNINFYYKDVTRPEYDWRRFNIVKDFDMEKESIYIFVKTSF